MFILHGLKRPDRVKDRDLIHSVRGREHNIFLIRAVYKLLVSDLLRERYTLAEIEQLRFGLICPRHDLRLVVIRVDINIGKMILIIVADQLFDQFVTDIHILRTEKDIIPAGHPRLNL